MAKAILYDATKCIGCRACQVACKEWWGLPAEKTTLNPDWTNPRDLSPVTWMYIKFVGKVVDEEFQWHFARFSCMHCDDPQCAKACPVNAITKYEEGPVVIDQTKCIGCRYCVAVCPFNVPRYDPATKVVYKCQFCYDRIKVGLEPACVKACTTGALKFGDKDELREEAERKAKEIGGYTYGIREAGGTSLFIVTKLPPSEIGYPTVPESQTLLPASLRKDILRPLSELALVAAIGTAGVISLAQFRASRKNRIKTTSSTKETEEKKGGE